MNTIHRRHMVVAAFAVITIFLLTSFFSAPNHKPLVHLKIGAYYFDGWNTGSPGHLNPYIKQHFPEREPQWGWLTSSPEVMAKQIDAAADAHIDFFNFCWYYHNTSPDSLDADPKNSALKSYLQAPNKSKLGFALLVANHKGYLVKKEHWPYLIKYWCKLFKDPMYVKANGKPLITFFDMGSLITSFGGLPQLHEAFQQFRDEAKAEGLPGVSIAGCVHIAPASLARAKACGYDIVTSYNQHDEGFRSPQGEVQSVNALQSADQNDWTQIAQGIDVPQIPTVTLNWDPRPLDSGKVIMTSRIEGYSANSVKKSISDVIEWASANESKMTDEKIVNVYAWNEYGEGSWLTPSKTGPRDSLITSFREAVSVAKQ